MARIFHLFIFILLLGETLHAQDLAIIPKPKEIQTQKGNFLLSKETTLQYDAENIDVARIAQFFNDYLNSVYDFSKSGFFRGLEERRNEFRRIHLV